MYGGIHGVSHYLITARYNRSLLNHRDPFSRDQLSLTDKPGINTIEATEETLLAIRQAMEARNRKIRRLKILALLIAIPLAIVAMWFLIHVMQECTVLQPGSWVLERNWD
ncbi:MAG: hypothetical protein AAGB22_01880 [Bacteroidota bacterium]